MAWTRATVVLKSWLHGIGRHGVGPFGEPVLAGAPAPQLLQVRPAVDGGGGTGDLLLDIGSGSTPIASWGQFAYRIALDIRPHKGRLPGVEYVYSDWMTWEPPRRRT